MKTDSLLDEYLARILMKTGIFLNGYVRVHASILMKTHSFLNEYRAKILMKIGSFLNEYTFF